MKFFGRTNENAPKQARVNFDSPKTGLPELDESPELFKLMFFALDEACNEIVRTGKQDPLAVIDTPEGQFIQGFRNERLEFGYEEARQALLTAPSDAQRYALSWAGYLTIQGVRYETVMVGGGGRGKARGVMIGQRYKQHLPDNKFQPIGNPTILGPGDNLLTLASDPEATSKLRPVFERITADVDHNHSTGNEKAQIYEFGACQELLLSFGDLDLPFRQELMKKPDMIHVIMGQNAWATVFKPDAKEVYLARDTLVPIRGGKPFSGFAEDGVIMIGYMPSTSPRDDAVAVGLFVLWAGTFKVKSSSKRVEFN
jgi:hypothetical protein